MFSSKQNRFHTISNSGPICTNIIHKISVSRIPRAPCGLCIHWWLKTNVFTEFESTFLLHKMARSDLVCSKDPLIAPNPLLRILVKLVRHVFLMTILWRHYLCRQSGDRVETSANSPFSLFTWTGWRSNSKIPFKHNNCRLFFPFFFRLAPKIACSLHRFLILYTNNHGKDPFQKCEIKIIILVT